MIIVLFHVLYIFGKFVYEKYRRNTKKSTNVYFSSPEWTDPESPDALVDYDNEVVLKFCPPAYLQRYVAVQKILSDAKYEGKLRKVVDYGCSELGFLAHLKRTPGIEEILCIDIDRCILEANVRKAEPLSAEYLNCRPTPLSIEIYEGSIVDRDKRLEKTDAVVCIELIEHLYPDTLTDFPFNVFGYIKPKLAIITTPNADFNVLFPNFSRFRHDDHKFEWTRQQFQDWAENIVLRYPQYAVTFHGICDGPPGTEHLGSCTQMAVFHRIVDADEVSVFGMEGLLKLVDSQEYPYRMDNRSDEQKILDEAIYHIRRLSSYSYDDTMEEVPLQRLWELLQKCNVSLESLRTILIEGGWAVEDHEDGPVVLVPPVSTYSDNSMVENEFWPDDEDDANSDRDGSDDPWDDEPGPSITYLSELTERERTRFFDNWQNENENWDRGSENWDEEPSIIIPQSNSVVQDNTYLFDGVRSTAVLEDTFSSNIIPLNESTSSRVVQDDIDCVSMPANFEENREINDLQNISFSPIEPHRRDIGDSGNLSYNDESINGLILNETIEFATAINDVSTNQLDSVMERTIHQKVKRALEFQAYISSTRSSTSAQPFLSDSICVTKLPHDTTMDSETDSMHHSMLNNTFRNFDMSLVSTITEIASQDDIDAAISNVLIQSTPITSDSSYTYTDSHHKSDANISDNTLTGDDANSIEKSFFVNVNTVVDDRSTERSETTDVFTASLPRYASSPRVGTKSEKARDIKEIETQLLSEVSDVSDKSNSEKNAAINPSKDNSLKCEEEVDAGKINEDINSKNTVHKTWSKEAHVLLDKRNTVNLPIDIDQTKINSDKRETKNDTVRDTSKAINISLTVAEICNETLETKPRKFTKSMISSENVHNVSDKECAKEFTCTSTSTINTNSDKESLINIPSNLSKSKEQKTESKQKQIHGDSSEDISSKYETGHAEAKEESSELLETPPNSWSPEIMDSGYPNSASAQDITPEYDLSSIAQDRISDAESPSVAEPPRLVGFVEPVEVENGDLANNNRDGEGNNMIAVEANRLEDLQPLIDVLENDMENENDIYVLENGFPMWLLRILEMANPLDLEAAHHDFRLFQAPDLEEERDEGCARLDQDEGFKSSSFENDSDTDAENAIEMENDTIDDDSENENGNENEISKNVDEVEEAEIKT